MKFRNYSIDFIKDIMTICVIIGHIYCVLFRREGEQLVIMQNVAVDVFFVISGSFIAQYFDLHKEMSCKPQEIKAFGRSMGNGAEKTYLHFVEKRLVRLYPMYILTAILWCAYRILQGNELELSKYFFQIFFLGSINSFAGQGVEWYVSCLFWGSVILAGILSYARIKAVIYYFPMLMLVLVSMMHSLYGNLSLNGGGDRIINGIVSAGCLKALFGLLCGIELYYIAEYILKRYAFTNIAIKTVIVVSLELIATVGIAYCFTRREVGDTDWLVYLFFPILYLIIWTDNSIIYRFSNYKIWGILAQYTYTVYLTHMFVITVYKNYFWKSCENQYSIYALIIVLSFVVGIIMFYIEALIRRTVGLFVKANIKKVV